MIIKLGFLKTLLLAWCATLLLSGAACAELAPVPTLKARVTDLTQTLTPSQQDQLEAKLAAFERQRGSQIAVLIVPSVQPEDIAQFSIRVVDVWKLGRAKQDDGVLIVVAKNNRKTRIEVGYGLEGAIPDVLTKRIISEIMAPSFKQGNYYAGINNATDAIMHLIEGEHLPAPSPDVSNSKADNLDFDGLLPVLFFASLILGALLRVIFGNFFGGALTGGVIGILFWLLGSGLIAAILFGIIAFVITLFSMTSPLGSIGGYAGGYGGNDTTSSGGFSGGGGGFGGGGASGDW